MTKEENEKRIKLAAVSSEDNSHLSDKELNEMFPNTYKGVVRAVGLDKPHKVLDIPAGHMGIDILGDDGKTEIQKPPDNPYPIEDYSQLLTSLGEHKQVE